MCKESWDVQLCGCCACGVWLAVAEGFAINQPAGQCRVVAGKGLVGDEFVSGKDVQKPDNDSVSWRSMLLCSMCMQL
jgi:hypothetical protein